MCYIRPKHRACVQGMTQLQARNPPTLHPRRSKVWPSFLLLCVAITLACSHTSLNSGKYWFLPVCVFSSCHARSLQAFCADWFSACTTYVLKISAASQLLQFIGNVRCFTPKQLHGRLQVSQENPKTLCLQQKPTHGRIDSTPNKPDPLHRHHYLPDPPTLP